MGSGHSGLYVYSYNSTKIDEIIQSKFDFIHNGEKLFIPKNTIIKNKKIIAGKCSKNKLRIEKILIEKHGGIKGEWKKCVGAVITAKYLYDIHWYELNGKHFEYNIKNRKIKNEN